MQEDNVFNQGEYQEGFLESPDMQVSIVEEKSFKNCHGHYTSIQSGGNGHFKNDRCGCEDSTVSIDSFIYLSVGVIIALFLIIKNTKNEISRS